MTPREFQALTRQWTNHQDFQKSLYAELHATLRNSALGKGFIPPSGEFWTAAMLLPGYECEAKKPDDWKRDKELMKRMISSKTPLTAKQRKDHFQSVREMQRRTVEARQMSKAGASAEAIKQMMVLGV